MSHAYVSVVVGEAGLEQQRFYQQLAVLIHLEALLVLSEELLDRRRARELQRRDVDYLLRARERAVDRRRPRVYRACEAAGGALTPQPS